MESTEPLEDAAREVTVGVGSQTLMRGLDVIEAIARDVLGVPELADRLMLIEGTTHRLACALVERGYLAFKPRVGYRHGPVGSRWFRPISSNSPDHISKLCPPRPRTPFTSAPWKGITRCTRQGAWQAP